VTEPQEREPEPQSQPLQSNTDVQPTPDDTRKAWEREHDEQLARQQRMDDEIAAAGDPQNVGSDGEPHFLKMIPKEGVDASEGDHDPDDFDYVCGSDGQPWPCPEAQEIERKQAEARGEQPAAS
jgi:hypothetical protein